MRRVEIVAKLRRAESADRDRLHAAESPAQATEIVERLLSSTSGALMLLRAVDRRELPAEVVSLTIEKAARHADASVRDLFERFLPPERRVRRKPGRGLMSRGRAAITDLPCRC